MNPLTREPQFVIRNKGDITKLYYNKGLSKCYKYYDKDEQKKAAESMDIRCRIVNDLYGEWKYDKLDRTRLQEHPIRYNVKDLPGNVIIVSHGRNDDDDNSEAGAERIRDSADFMRRTNKEYMRTEEEDEKENEGGEEVKLHKEYRRDGYADNEGSFSPARSQRSDVYKEEIINLREVNQRLTKEIEEMIKTYLELTSEFEQHNKALEDNIRLLEEENNYYREIEEIAKQGLDELKSEYPQKVAELGQKETNNKKLQEQID